MGMTYFSFGFQLTSLHIKALHHRHTDIEQFKNMPVCSAHVLDRVKYVPRFQHTTIIEQRLALPFTVPTSTSFEGDENSTQIQQCNK